MPSVLNGSQPPHASVRASLPGLHIRDDPAHRWTKQQYLPSGRAVSERPGVLRATKCRTRQETLDFRVVGTTVEVTLKAEGPPVLQRVAMDDLDVTVIDALDASSPW